MPCLSTNASHVGMAMPLVRSGVVSFNHGGENRHPPRTGGMKEFFLQLDHMEQEILLSIRMGPRIDSGSRGETQEEEQPHREPDQSESSDVKPRNGSRLGRPAKKAVLTLQQVSPQSEQVERVAVEIGESRSRPCRMAHRSVSKRWLQASWSWLERDWQQRRKTSLMRLCRKGKEILTAWRSLAQGPVEDDTPESDENWMEHSRKQYEGHRLRQF